MNMNKTNNKSTTTTMKKAGTDRTVFVRFVPPSSSIRRHHLEELFSQVGPIKKSSVIVPPPPRGNGNSTKAPPPGAPGYAAAGTAAMTASSYGFIKYTSPQDAQRAKEKLHRKKLVLSPTETVTVFVEQASNATAPNTTTPSGGGSGGGAAAEAAATTGGPPAPSSGGRRHDNHRPPYSSASAPPSSPAGVTLLAEAAKKKKRTNRLIVRNLAFRATEADIRKALEDRFGPLEEIHLPQVPSLEAAEPEEGGGGDADEGRGMRRKKKKEKKLMRHRGFAFVTFEQSQHATACLEGGRDLEIRGRAVTVDATLDKTSYEDQKQKQQQRGQRQPRQQQREQVPKKTKGEEDDDKDPKTSANVNEEEESGDADPRHQEDEDGSSSSSSSQASDQDDGDEEEAEEDGSTNKASSHSDNAIAEKRTLFLRNLPFDVTRHDVFELMRKFGRIGSIFLVKDRQTGLFQGTAFCTFERPPAAARALQAAGRTTSFVSQKAATTTSQQQEADPVAADDAAAAATTTGGGGGLLQLKGRNLLVDLAVDKETAHTLTSEKHEEGREGRHQHGNDRRNLYLKTEGRVDDDTNKTNTWQDLPEADQLKRQRAWSEKNSKLNSPLFFINSKRLSFRNLAKHVDEATLKQLCVLGAQRGLQKGLVSAQDQIAHYKAVGELTTREILAKIQALDGSTGSSTFLPAFDDKNIRKFIPSVFIERDFERKKNSDAPSRGYGFVEFTHHVHALACLRELNNNTAYTEEYVIGGKQACRLHEQQKNKRLRKASKKTKASGSEEHGVKLPRLVVELTVENKAKAKQQAEHRAQQEANLVKQKREHRERIVAAEDQGEDEDGTKKQKRKKSRGALQRERKRKKRQGGEGGGEGEMEPEEAKTKPNGRQAAAAQDDDDQERSNVQPVKPKPPPKKKRKVDKEEAKFTELVETYERSFAGTATKGEETDGVSNKEASAEGKEKQEKRWFE